MKHISIVLTLTFALGASTGFAGPQQNKMKECNQKAAGMKGDERKAFMKTCLSAKAEEAPAATATTPQQRMKDCNAKAKGMKGQDRKTFMSSCLKGA